MHVTTMVALAALAVLLAGCETAPIKELRQEIEHLFQGPGKAEETLKAGISAYDDARYAESSRLLQSSLDQGLALRADRIRAHKYLAFIHCVSGRQAQCRSEFRNVLKLDASYELSEAEAGHPMWGPVFRNVKSQSK